MNKDNENKGTVKSSKPRSLWNRIGKKVTASAVGFGLILGAVFGFAGCTDHNKPGPTPPGPGPGPIDPNPPIVVVDNIKMSNFLTENAAIADIFIGDLVRPEAISAIDDDIKSEKCTLVASEDQEYLQQVNFVYTLKTGKTTRAVKLATVTMNEDLTFNKIVEHYTSQSKLANDEFDVIKNVSTQTIFEFDAKENYDRQDVADAVYAAYNKTSDVKLFNQTESTQKDLTRLQLLEDKGNKYTVFQLDVLEGETDDALIFNLQTPEVIFNKTTVSTHTVDGTVYYDNAYELEDIKDGSEVDPPVVETITKQQIIDALDANCKDALITRCLLGIEHNKEDISEGNWYLIKAEDGSYIGAEYIFTLTNSNTDAYYTIGKVTFDGINAKDLASGNFQNVKYSNAYRFNYIPASQERNKELTNAICETLFGTQGDNYIARYIVDNGYNVGDPKLGLHNQFTVIEITDKGVTESGINIKKNDVNDANYIEKLSNEDNYRTYGEKAYTLTGEEVKDITIETPATTKTANKATTSAARYVITFDDSDEIMYI